MQARRRPDHRSDGPESFDMEAAFSTWLGSLSAEGTDPQEEAERILAGAPPVLEPILRQQFEEVLELAASTIGATAGSLEGREIGGYRIGELLGRGATGSVWSATDAAGSPCAVKFVHGLYLSTPDGAARLAREVQAARRVDHPGVLRIHDVIDEDGFFALVTELVGDGSTLASEIAEARDRDRHADAQEVLRRMIPVVRAVGALHAAGVLHLDLKPGNLLVDDRGDLRVSDLGLARLTDQVGSTRTFQILGTPAYMSPEVAGGDRVRADERSDLFSLGVTLFEALTLSRPFQGSGRGVTEAIQHEAPRPLRGPLVGISPRQVRALRSILARCLEKRPARRYPDAESLAVDLEAVLAGRPVQGSPASRRFTAGLARHRRAVLAGVVVVALSAGAWRERRLRRDTVEALALTNQLVEGMRLGAEEQDEEELMARLSELLRRVGDHALQRASLRTIGDALMERGTVTRAHMALLEEALASAPADGVERGEILVDLGTAYARRWEHQEATANLFAGASLLLDAEDVGQRLRGALAEARAQESRVRFGLSGPATWPEPEETVGRVRDILADRPAQADSTMKQARGAILELEVLQLESRVYPDEPVDPGRVEELAGQVDDLLPAHDPERIRALTVAGDLLRTGDLIRAAALLERALEDAASFLGAQHPLALNARLALAQVRLEAEQPERALELYTLAIEGARAQFGEENRAVLKFEIARYVTLTRLGRYEEAHELVPRVLASGIRSLGAEDPDVLIMRRAQIEVFLREGEWQGAREAVQEQLELYRNGFPRYLDRYPREEWGRALILELLAPEGTGGFAVLTETLEFLEKYLDALPVSPGENRTWRHVLDDSRDATTLLELANGGRIDELEDALTKRPDLFHRETILGSPDTLRVRARRVAKDVEGARALLPPESWHSPRTAPELAQLLDAVELGILDEARARDLLAETEWKRVLQK